MTTGFSFLGLATRWQWAIAMHAVRFNLGNNE